MTESVVELGLVEFYRDPAIIEVPESGRLGVPFLVTVTTYGGGCISHEATVADVNDEGADVSPYDRRLIPGPGGDCTSELQHIPHEVFITFDSVGTKTIRIHGRRVDDRLDEVIELPVTLVVD